MNAARPLVLYAYGLRVYLFVITSTAHAVVHVHTLQKGVGLKEERACMHNVMADDADALPAEYEEEDEPLFADDLDDDDPPPLPPPLQGLGSSTLLSSTDDGNGLRVGLGPQQRGTDQQAGERRRRRDADGDEGEGRQPVKRMKRPVPTLTVDRLFSDRGIPYLIEEFPKKKFKGKGHEATDLKTLLQEYEQWANALYPKLTFHDFTKRVEAIGSNNKDFKARFMMLRRRAGGLPPLEVDEGEANREEEETNRDGEETNRDGEETNRNGEETNRNGEETNREEEEMKRDGEEMNREEEETREEMNGDEEETNRETNRDVRENEETATDRDEGEANRGEGENANREEGEEGDYYHSILLDNYCHTADNEEAQEKIDEHFNNDLIDYESVRGVEENNGTGDE